MNRILEPNGVLALIGYNNNQIIDLNNHQDFRLNQMIMDFCLDNRLAIYNHNQLNQYNKNQYNKNQHNSFNHMIKFQSIKFPIEHFHDCQYYDSEFIHTKDIQASDLIQAVKCWSNFKQFKVHNDKGAQELLDYFENNLKNIVQQQDLNKVNLVVETPFFVKLGRIIANQ